MVQSFRASRLSNLTLISFTDDDHHHPFGLIDPLQISILKPDKETQTSQFTNRRSIWRTFESSEGGFVVLNNAMDHENVDIFIFSNTVEIEIIFTDCYS